MRFIKQIDPAMAIGAAILLCFSLGALSAL
jgi:hypothetical protein